MLTNLVAFMLAFAASALLTPLVRLVAPLVGGLDRAASSRKVHTTPVPRLGGVAIAVAFYVPLAGLFVYVNDISRLLLRDNARVTGLLAGGVAIALLGLYDDLHGANARVKFTVQILVAVLMYMLGYRIEGVSVPWADTLWLGPLSGPLTVLWIVGIVNAVNLIDGLDGLAGGVAFIVVGLNFAVAFNRPDVLMCLFMAALGGAVAGFLLYNFNPASIFMGDTGSMFLGFVLAVTTIQSASKGAAVVSMLVPIVALGLPIADTLLAMLRRALRGRPIFAADREHIHHKLLAMGFTHRGAVLALYGVCLMLAAAAFALTYASSHQIALLLGGLGLLAAGGMRLVGFRVDREWLRENAAARTRNQDLRALVRDVGRRLQGAEQMDALWESVKTVGAALGARELSLSLVVKEGGGEQVHSVLIWRPDGSAAGPRPGAAGCAVTLDLQHPGTALETGAPRPLGQLRVAWTSERRVVERDEEIALEMLADHVETALDRIRRAAEADRAPGGR